MKDRTNDGETFSDSIYGEPDRQRRRRVEVAAVVEWSCAAIAALALAFLLSGCGMVADAAWKIDRDAAYRRVGGSQ